MIASGSVQSISAVMAAYRCDRDGKNPLIIIPDRSLLPRIFEHQRLGGHGCDPAAEFGDVALAVGVEAIAEKDHRRLALRVNTYLSDGETCMSVYFSLG